MSISELLEAPSASNDSCTSTLPPATAGNFRSLRLSRFTLGSLTRSLGLFMHHGSRRTCLPTAIETERLIRSGLLSPDPRHESCSLFGSPSSPPASTPPAKPNASPVLSPCLSPVLTPLSVTSAASPRPSGVCRLVISMQPDLPAFPPTPHQQREQTMDSFGPVSPPPHYSYLPWEPRFVVRSIWLSSYGH